jgi:hypothetical protein
MHNLMIPLCSDASLYIILQVRILIILNLLFVTSEFHVTMFVTADT